MSIKFCNSQPTEHILVANLRTIDYPNSKKRDTDQIKTVFIHHQAKHVTVLVLSKLKKINAIAPQPQRNVLKYFAIFKSVAHSLEPDETPSYSASHQAPNYVQRS